MNIAIVTCMQNSSSKNHISRFFDQAEAFGRQMKDLSNLNSVRVIISEGDSSDDTATRVREMPVTYFQKVVVDGSTGSGREYGSVVSKARFKQFAYAANCALNEVQLSDDVVIIVESDLIWEPKTFRKLAFRVEEAPTSVYAPIPVAASLRSPTGWRLYDTWAFRSNGNGPFSIPAHGPWEWDGGGWVEMDSVGSCLAVPGQLARTIRMPDEDVVVGFCRQIRERGVKIYACGDLKVIHP